MMRIAAGFFSLAVLVTAAPATAALANEPVYTVSDASTLVDSSQWEYLDVPGVASSVPAVGILFTVSSPSIGSTPLLVLCDDLFQNVYVPVHYSPGLTFDAEPLSGNFYYATGNQPSDEATFTPQQASELGLLVTQAQAQWNGGGTPGVKPSFASDLNLNQSVAAIQGAMWSIEYGKDVTSLDPNAAVAAEIDSAIGGYEAEYAGSDVSGALGLYSVPDGVQDQVLGFRTSPTPEPAAWAMMLAGVFLVSTVLRRTRYSRAARGMLLA